MVISFQLEDLQNIASVNQDLQSHLASAVSERDALMLAFADWEKTKKRLETSLAEKTRETESLLEFYSSRECNSEHRKMMSPTTPTTPVSSGTLSCYAEIQIVKLEEVNQELKERNSELEVCESAFCLGLS